MERKSRLGLWTGAALIALFCASVAPAQMYYPDEEIVLPPAPIPHRPPVYDPSDEPPPMEPPLERFPRAGAGLPPAEPYFERLPPPPLQRSIQRPAPMPEPGRAPPGASSTARLMTHRLLDKPSQARPNPIPPGARKVGRLGGDRGSSKGAPPNTVEGRSKTPVQQAVGRREGLAARLAPPVTAVSEKPSPPPAAAQVTRAADKVAKPSSSLDDVSSFINKGEGKFNLGE